MTQIVVDYQEIYKLEKEIRKINKSLEDMALIASRATGMMLLHNMDSKVNFAGLRYIKRSDKLDNLQLYLIQLASDFENVESRISAMNGAAYTRTKKDVINFVNRNNSDNIFYEYAMGTTFTVDNEGRVQLIIDGVSYVVLERKALVNYQKDMIKAHLATVLLNITNEDEYVINDVLKEILNHIIGGGYLSEEIQKKYKDYIEVAKKLASLFKDCGEDYVKIILTDYTRSVAILESLKKMNIDNEVLNIAVDEMILEYSNKFYAAAKKTYENIKNGVIDVLVDKAPLLKVTEYAQKIISVVSGSSKYAEHAKPLLASQQISADIGLAYERAIDVIRAGDHSDEAIKNAENLFDMLKNIRMEQYEHMIALCDDSRKKASLIKELNEIRQLEMY